MNQVWEAIRWCLDPSNWQGASGLGARSLEHLGYTALALLIAAAIAVPVGWWVGHTGRGRGLAVAVSGAARALPTLGVVTLMGLLLGIGLAGPMTAFVILAVPSILAAAYAGFEAVDRRVIDAAQAQGMTGRQVLWRIEVPLGLPLLIGGLRSAALQVIATATLAAYVGAGGLGRFLFLGLKTQDYAMMLGGSLIVVALAIVLDLAFAAAGRATVPRGVRVARRVHAT
ncbi:ABC transporter permease subunit [Citricoccus nitrophenolicus]|uniref:ABC transporter permease subunit n=1 Tax=Citricoccus nitrophenolicus TaxID=863575 RepID=A0ABV0IM04_9MICC|nr:ABC transporter permease subunit [Citricoccus sp. I39-566]WMY79531.1 ABC transporter permease subunit [Citricoccus sp. I39-566]